MVRMMIATLAFLATTTSAFATPCTGVDLAVRSVSVKGVTKTGNLNRYEITGAVTNVGAASQGSDALQSVDIYQDTEKLDSRSIPPLKAGQSYAFTYAFMRSSDAGNGTTHLRFQLNVTHPSPADSQICHMVNDSFTLTF